MAITISGVNNNDRIVATDGTIDALSGFNVVGLLTASHINVGSNIQLGNAGIITATTFVGNVTGNVNSTSPLLLQTGGSERFRITGNNELGIAGANYGSSGQVLTSGGSGSAVSWTSLPAQATIANNADNRVITGGSGVNLNGEANLTFDGSKLLINRSSAGSALQSFVTGNSSGGGPELNVTDGRSSTVPLYTFWYNNTTGIGNPAANTISFINGGTERVRIDSSGNMQVSAGQFTVGTTASTGLQFINDGTFGTIHSADLKFRTAATERLRITSAGLIQAKTRTASERRMILAGSPSNSAFNIEAHDGATGTSSGTVQGELGLYYNDGSTLSDTATIKFERGSGAPDGAMTIFTNNAERLRIDSSGRVMIGNTVAGQMFGGADDLIVGTTSGARGITIISENNTVGRLLFSDSLTSGAATYQGQVNYNHSTDTLDLRTYTGGSITLSTSNTERVTINSSGLVDIVNTCRATNFYLRGNGSAPTADASIFRPADNCFAIATGSTERVRVTNDLVNIKGGNLHVGTDSATNNFTDSNGGNTRHIEIGATGGGDALLTTHASGYGIGYFGYEAGGDRLVIACDQGGGSNSIDLITTAGTGTGGSTDNLNGKTARFQIRGNGGFRAENTDSNEVHAISNYDHGNNTYNHRNARTLTSNGTGWDGNESTDGADPILVLSVANRAGNSDIGDAYGIQLHSESQDDNDYGPLIGWTNRSNSGAYNTTYAAIVGQKTGQATDHNWSSGSLHFFTNKPGAGGYMNNVADLSIDQAGHVMMPRNSRFFAISNSGNTDSTNGATGIISNEFEAEFLDSNGDYDASNGRFTAPVDGAYEFHFAALHRAMSNSGSGELTFYKNGSNLSVRSFGYSNIGSGGSTNDHQHLHIHGIFDLSAGDYIEVYIYAQSSGMDFYFHQGLGYFSGKLLG